MRDLPTFGRGDRADIIIALTEDHLKTDVKRGENQGRTLWHTAVVRVMQPIGEATAELTLSYLAPKKDFPIFHRVSRRH